MKRKLITLQRIIHAGIVSFIRNASLAIAAMAVMVVTLTIVLFSVIANATFGNTIATITDRIDVSVFLKDTVTAPQREKLLSDLKAQPNVESVQYLSKEQALAAYTRQNAGNQSLLTAATISGNPIPATIRIKPNDLNRIQEIRAYLTTPATAALQTEGSPSYSGERKKAIDNITRATNILQRAGVIAVAVFAVISALIIFNTIQMAIFNRRDEITIERLLGASTWFIRGPFVVESILYGILSAILSLLFIYSVFVASSSALQASSFGLLDIAYAQAYFNDHFWILLLLQILVGILIGAASSIIATQRYLKFKTK
ncbi:MAG TPA: permease-like cell division protein FtsX [Candidatus Saccharimonadales bacterium]|nr:permease-like cell division protein FtsX [Candidatus Saccharimonadales bacterium]